MKLNLRGRYYGGGLEVTARRWWSRTDRQSARLTAMVLEDQRRTGTTLDVDGWMRVAAVGGECDAKLTYGAAEGRS